MAWSAVHLRLTAALTAAVLCACVLAGPAAAQSKNILDCGNGFPCPNLKLWGYSDRQNGVSMPWIALFHVPPGVCASFWNGRGCCDGARRFSVIQPNGVIHKDRTIRRRSGKNFIVTQNIDINALQGGWYTLHVTMPIEGIFSIFFTLRPINQAGSTCAGIPPS